MIRHNILFKVKINVPAETVEKAIGEFCELQDKLPNIFSITGGKCQFHGEKSSQFFTQTISHCISIDFKDQAAYTQFLNDPITLPAKKSILNVVEGGYDGLVGFDFMS